MTNPHQAAREAELAANLRALSAAMAQETRLLPLFDMAERAINRGDVRAADARALVREYGVAPVAPEYRRDAGREPMDARERQA